jgi:phosphatidylserine/phosphatidylglycerophosphate/cardiolipin synthase-like enzyme
MRKSVLENGIVVKAYAGTTGVLLAFNLKNDADRAGLLGFAIQKNGAEYLPTMIPFPGQPHKAGDPIPSNIAPVQKFRWSDYTVDAGTQYEYTVFAVRGDPNKPSLGQGATVTVTTEPRDPQIAINDPSKIITVSNRAVAASQAFSREFPATTAKLNAALASPKPKGKSNKTDGIMTAAEMKWLSNGLLEEIVGFIKLAKDASFALDIAIYQYELEDIYTAVDSAFQAGVDVRLVYHSKAGDAQTERNEASAKGLPAAAKYGRVTHAIFHHKFIILSKIDAGKRTPIAVLCGSTNFTSNGVFAQANNVQVTADPAIMAKYVAQFDFLFNQPTHTPAVTAVQDTEQNILKPAASLQVGFSPRNGRGDLDSFSSLINGATQDVLFATAFGLDKEIITALVGQPNDSILRYGIQDKPTNNVTGMHADKTGDFQAASALPAGLDGWLDEHRAPGAKGSILIHDKIIVIDFTSDSPVVINGSHNYSNAASASNDENYLIVHNDTGMADCLGVEIMRLYDHYRFRYVSQARVKKSAGQVKVTHKPLTLDTTNGWTNDYYDPTKLKYADRLVFSGMMHGGDARPGTPFVAKMSIQQARAEAAAPGTAGSAARKVRIRSKALKQPVQEKSTRKAMRKKPAGGKSTERKVVAKKTTTKRAVAKRAIAKKSRAKAVRMQTSAGTAAKKK